MASDDDRIRLPELVIFKKFSLALRQEFASSKDLLIALERSMTKVQKLAEKAKGKAQTDDESPPEFVVSDVFGEIDEEVSEDSEASSWEAEPVRAPAWERGSADTPIWEPEPSHPDQLLDGEVNRPDPPPAPRATRRPKPKRKAPKIEVIQVSRQGKPLARKKT